MDLQYVKILRFMMWTLGAWPGRQLGERVWKISDYYLYFLQVQALSSVIPGICYAVHEASNLPFLILGHIIISIVYCVTSTIKMPFLIMRRKYKEFSKIFFMKMHLFYYKDKSEYAMKIYHRVHKISNLCTINICFLFWSTLIFFIGGPIVLNISEGLYTQGIPENSTKVYAVSVYYRFPFDGDYAYMKNMRAHIIVNIFNWNVGYVCGAYTTILDLYIYIIVFHIWGHFKILTNDLQSIKKPAVNLTKSVDGSLLESYCSSAYSAEESKNINKKLKQCIDYHRVITDFTKMMSNVFGATLLIYSVYVVIVSCLLLVEISYLSAEAFLRYAPLTCLVFQEVVQLGVVFEFIGTASENLIKVVYDLPWEYMDTANRKIVLIMLINMQRPIRVKAMGMTDMGVATIAGIFKTSFSYYTFLRN